MAEDNNTNNKVRTKLPKKEAGIASFSTRPARISQLGSNLGKPLNFKDFKNKLGPKIALIGACFLVGFGGGWLGAGVNNGGNGAINTSTAARQQYISNESELIAGIAKETGQSVVSIDVQRQVRTEDFFGFGRTTRQQSAGTGFIVDSKGIIVTNRHVVPAAASEVSITLEDGTSYDNVEVIGRTREGSPLDIAFLKIRDLKGKTLAPVKIGDSSKVKVGEKVIAIGNALGQFQNTVTSGIISGYGRDVIAGDESGIATESLTDLFQTDAAINQGNSGGPLVNINGEVIGVNTAVAGSAQNIGFAIPINDVKGLIETVLTEGELKQPYLGVRYVSLTNDLASQFNLKVNRGAYITADGSEPAVVEGSPADKAGIQEKDVITKVNNITIDDKTSLTSALGRFKVGDAVNLSVIRNGNNITVKATLEAAPQT